MKSSTFVLAGSITVVNAKVGAFQITTPATGLPITLLPTAFSCDKATVSITLLEDYSFTEVLASVLTPLDKRRALPTETASTVVKVYTDITPDAGSAALTLDQYAFSAASGSTDTIKGGWILKPNTTYLIAISNGNAAPAVLNYGISWTESV